MSGIHIAIVAISALLDRDSDHGSTGERILTDMERSGLRVALDVVRGVLDGDRLTIRDRFAAHALVGLLGQPYLFDSIPSPSMGSFAETAYDAADAMIAERQEVGAV